MITKKIILVVLLALFAFLNSCKKEAKNIENKSTIIKNTTEHEVATNERLTPDMYAKRMDSIKVQIVDIRTQPEFNEGHIEHAVNINVLDSTFMTKMSKYPKKIPVYVYCTAGGKRSIDAAKKLHKKGYNVVNLDGGIIAWTKEGYKVVK